jgi:hypothetical protein
VEWSEQFYAWRAGDGCPSCAEGRPQSTSYGERWFAGECCDAYLARADIQRGLTIAVFCGRHVVEPTDLTNHEAAVYVPHLHTHVVPATRTTHGPPGRSRSLTRIRVPCPRTA